MMTPVRAFLLTGLLLITESIWANCAILSGNVERTADGSFTDHGNGTVTHATTGLMWKKCPEGRSYSAGSCTGSTGSYTWQQALRRGVLDTTTGGQSDWRLPSRSELLSIVETGCSGQLINTSIFPNIPSSSIFWTSTHTGDLDPLSAWLVRFSTGQTVIYEKANTAYVRLVRGGNTAHDTYRATAPTEPAAFSFTNQAVSPGATAISNNVTMSGLTASRTISISGGQYRINGGVWTAANGSIANGNTLALSVVAPNTVPGTASATVNVNGRTAAFKVTTDGAASDSTPDAFSFADQANAAIASTITSNAITVAGIDTFSPISVTGGEYEINDNGVWMTDPALVTATNTVRVRHTSSASFVTATNTVLTIGGVSDTFTSTTQSNDTTPDAFVFTDLTNVGPSTQVTSNSISVSGINNTTAISITGGEYEKNGSGTWTSGAGTVVNGNTVRVRHTSAATNPTAINTVLTIGGVSDTFTTTTGAPDTTPNAFAFTDQTNVALSAAIVSNAITVAGVNTATPVSISVIGGEYEKNTSGVWANTTGTVIAGDTIRVRHTSSSSELAQTNTVLTIGGISDTFTSTTGDTTPATFTFTDVTGVDQTKVYESNAITVSGITAPASIAVTAGSASSEYQINGGAWSAGATVGTVSNGNTVKVRHTSSNTDTTVTNTTLTIGGVSDTYTTTTGDVTPSAFSLVSKNGQAASALIESATITVAGITAGSAISVSGAADSQYSVNAGAYTSAPGWVTNGQTVKVRHTSDVSGDGVTTSTLNIGGLTSNFTTTTCSDSQWTSFVNKTSTGGTNCTRQPINLDNMCAGTTMSFSTGSSTQRFHYSVNNSTFTGIGTSATGPTIGGGTNPSLWLRYNNATTSGTARVLTITIGGTAKTWTHTASASGTTCSPAGDFQ